MAHKHMPSTAGYSPVWGGINSAQVEGAVHDRR